MLFAVLCIILYVAVLKIFNRSIRKKISVAETVEEALALRKRARFQRRVYLRVSIIFFILIFCYAEYFLLDGDIFWSTEKSVALIFDLCIFLLGIIVAIRKENRKGTLSGNLSTQTRSYFLSHHRRFSLYLRGFDTDDYSNKMSLNQKEASSRFSEFHFSNQFQKFMPLCTVGMTKELDAPYGAERVYVDDTTWKNEVLDLMEKASYIFILVNDRNSCIWELEQSADMQDKTIYIVDDMEKYDKVKSLLEGHINLPNLAQRLEENNSWFIRSIPQEDIQQYPNTPEGYALYLKLLMEKTPRNIKKGDTIIRRFDDKEYEVIEVRPNGVLIYTGIMGGYRVLSYEDYYI